MAATPHICMLRSLPDNFPAFQKSIFAAIEHIYGAEAARSFRVRARRAIAEQLRRNNVIAWAAQDQDGRTAAILVMALDGDRARTTLFHVLPEYRGDGFAAALMAHAISALRENGMNTLLCDTALGDNLGLDALCKDGLQAHPRLIMRADVQEVAGHGSDAPRLSQPLQPKQFHDVATSLLAAYRDHPDSRLYGEMRVQEEAVAFLDKVTRGDYGQLSPGWMRGLWRENSCQGAVIATRVFPKTVFILQVFIHPRYQRQGRGRRLLSELAQTVSGELPDAALALGVSAGNPAYALYKHLGFASVRETTAYFWEKHTDAPVPMPSA